MYQKKKKEKEKEKEKNKKKEKRKRIDTEQQYVVKKQALKNTKLARIPETIQKQVTRQSVGPPGAVLGALWRLFGMSWSV